MIESSCHCGLLKVQIEADLPETFTSCNCSICSRYGSLMAYYPVEKDITNLNSCATSK